MSSILNKLYYGGLYPYATYSERIKELKACREKVLGGHEAFMEKLPKELHGEFVALLDNHLELLPLEMEQNFTDGFCMGARLVMETFYALRDE